MILVVKFDLIFKVLETFHHFCPLILMQKLCGRDHSNWTSALGLRLRHVSSLFSYASPHEGQKKKKITWARNGWCNDLAIWCLVKHALAGWISSVEFSASTFAHTLSYTLWYLGREVVRNFLSLMRFAVNCWSFIFCCSRFPTKAHWPQSAYESRPLNIQLLSDCWNDSSAICTTGDLNCPTKIHSEGGYYPLKGHLLYNAKVDLTKCSSQVKGVYFWI